MGKKLAAGSKTIVLDVKYGSGSFMKSAEDAEILAEKMVAIGKRCGRRVAALISDMDTPLGRNIGNALEVSEAISLLKGEGAEDLCEICIELASEMAASVHGITKDEAKAMATEALSSGKAYAKFLEWIEAQGGNTGTVKDTSLLPKADYMQNVCAPSDGYIFAMNAEALGTVALNLGAGRRTKDDVIDHAAGIILHKKTGDKIKKGDVIATLFTNRADTLTSANDAFLNAITVTADEPKARPLIHRIIR
jgi:thymidine phosphorylase